MTCLAVSDERLHQVKGPYSFQTHWLRWGSSLILTLVTDNCDKWHLPKPCDKALVTCSNCNHIGHLPTFCPQFPNARLRPLGDSTVVKRQRTDSTKSEYGNADIGMPLVRDISKVHPELIRQIQAQAVSAAQTSGNLMEQQHAMEQREPLDYQSRPHSTFNALNHHQRITSSSNAVLSPYANSYGHPKPHEQYLNAELQNLPTPLPSSAIKPAGVVAAADAPIADAEEPHNHLHAPHRADASENTSVGLITSDTAETTKTGRWSRKGTPACAACRKLKVKLRARSHDLRNAN